MLRFHGIQFNLQGTPERFRKSLVLKDPLAVCLDTLRNQAENQLETSTKINQEINNLFQKNRLGTNFKDQVRNQVARWFQARDILDFIYINPESSQLKLEIADIIVKPGTISQKWDIIKPLLVKKIKSLSPEEKEDFLSKANSDLNLVFQMVSLFFMEQDSEAPPCNLEMVLLRKNFPKIIWKRNDGISKGCDPFWQPKNSLCSSSHLIANVMTEIEKSSVSFQTLSELEPESIELILDSGENSFEQFKLFQESIAESLIGLQKLIQRKYSWDGVKHLLAILRQLNEKQNNSICLFDKKQHLALVSRLNKRGESSEKQVSVMNGVMKILRGLKIKRTWIIEKVKKISLTPLITEIGKEITDQINNSEKIRLLLDDILLPKPGNTLSLGNHLKLLPNKVFRESTQKHSLIPSLSSYFTGNWLLNFKNSNIDILKSSREIVEACCFNIGPSNKFSILQKLKSEISYMSSQGYIGDFDFQPNLEGNPWKDFYKIAPPSYLIQSLDSPLLPQRPLFLN